MNLWIEGARKAVPLPETPAARLVLMRQAVPLFPWIPLVPAALVIGASIAALTLAARANRRVKALEAELCEDEAHESLHQQPLETISP